MLPPEKEEEEGMGVVRGSGDGDGQQAHELLQGLLRDIFVRQ